MNTYKETIAKNIRMYRQQAKISQKELASKLGISSAAVSNWEKGQNSIDIDTLFKVCDILNVDVSRIAGKMAKTNSLTPDEQALIEKYRVLDSYGIKTVTDIIDNEFNRCIAQDREKESNIS